MLVFLKEIDFFLKNSSRKLFEETDNDNLKIC